MVEVKFSDEAKEVYDFLDEQSKRSKKERMLFRSLNAKLELIRADPHYGCQIGKRLIPGYYRKKYLADNLFRVELPLFWRMLYMISKKKDEIEIIAFILDVFDHKDYDKRFGYKKR
jgi:cell division FtsZ-interacting protein ZapD